MRVGVVGCGYWGAKHIRVLSSLSRVDQVAAIDPQPTRRAAVTRSFPAVIGFDSLEQAAPELDAVVIATPPATHAGLAVRAMRLGLDVLVEKPMAVSAAEAEWLIAEAAVADRILMVGHTYEYNAWVWKMRDILRDGDLGEIYYIDTARLNLGLYQPDVNVVWDLAPHDISIVNYLLGAAPTAVQAWGVNHAHANLEDVAYVRLDYAEVGVTAQVHVSWLDPCKVRRLTVVGSRRMAVYNDLADEERIRVYDKGVEPHAATPPGQAPMSYRYGGIVLPYVHSMEPLQLEDEHFVDCVRERGRPRTDGASGLAVVRVLEAAAHSLEQGRAVRLDEVIEPAESLQAIGAR